MKKILLLIFSLSFLLSKAQTTFPAAGADWHYMTLVGLGSIGPTYYSHTEIKYTHDTIIGNRVAAVISNSSYFKEEDMPGSGSNYFYSSNDSVFLYNAYSLNKWQLLYSFNTPIGQSWQFSIRNVFYNADSTTWIVHVDSINHIIINNDTLKRLYVNYHDSDNYFHYSSSIIERIGDVNYLLNILDGSVFGLCDGCGFIKGLLCYQDSSFNLYQPDASKSCNYTTAGINQFTNTCQITIYPNPAQNKITIDALGVVDIKLFDLLGKQILSTKENYLDVSNLNDGVYFIQVKTNTGTSTQKIIVQH